MKTGLGVVSHEGTELPEDDLHEKLRKRSCLSHLSLCIRENDLNATHLGERSANTFLEVCYQV